MLKLSGNEGVNQASTFTGFCSYHDNHLFSALEDELFTCSKEQCFLLGYRALIRELFTKKASSSLNELQRKLDRGKMLDEQFRVQAMALETELGVLTGLKDSIHHKQLYDNLLQRKIYEDVRYLRISIEHPPPIMASGGIFPEVDFYGNTLQDLGDLESIPHLLNFTSFFGDEQGEIVFTWLSESHSTCVKVIESLIAFEKEQVTNALVRFFFEFCENIFLAPNWWETLDEEKKQHLTGRMTNAVNPLIQRNPNCLMDDGLDYDMWNIVEIKKGY